MPPDQKEQIRYAKYNRLAVRYVWLLGGMIVILAGIFAGAFYLIDQQAQQVASDVADKQATIAALNKTFTPKAKDASDRLNAIKFVQSSQTKFSAVVSDIAKVIPKGVSIDSLTLTGDSNVPVRIAVTAQTYSAALSLRDALITSPRIAGADLESISSNGVTYQTSVVIAFKPGMAK
ncbi:MAG TPA: PilN domain-containing protein [Candidatus Saccharimonadia bacterium]|nr:PilN domain-containing protein [Candidatus Saccharimonadia bacterium]